MIKMQQRSVASLQRFCVDLRCWHKRWETHRQLVDGGVLVDDVEDGVVVGEEGLVVHGPLEGGVRAFEHRRCVALKHTRNVRSAVNLPLKTMSPLSYVAHPIAKLPSELFLSLFCNQSCFQFIRNQS